MASKSIQSISNVSLLDIGHWQKNNQTFFQVQIEMKNGRRFILKDLRTTNIEFCKSAIEIIQSDGFVNLAEFVEVKPSDNSPAYKIMEAKGFLKNFTQ